MKKQLAKVLPYYRTNLKDLFIRLQGLAEKEVGGGLLPEAVFAMCFWKLMLLDSPRYGVVIKPPTKSHKGHITPQEKLVIKELLDSKDLSKIFRTLYNETVGKTYPIPEQDHTWRLGRKEILLELEY